MKIKKGVSLRKLQPQAVVGMMIAESVLRDRHFELTVTSGDDGQHKEGSKHYEGLAFDLRTWDFDRAGQKALVKTLQEAMGQDFDVVLEPDHIHVEYDPKEEKDGRN